MKEIAVAHTDLMAKGGGEGVCMNVLETLQDAYSVTLLTLTEPDLPVLNEYFETGVADVTVRRPRLAATALSAVDIPLYNLRNALLNRFVLDCEDEFDLVIGTDNEISPTIPSIQYIHTPRFGRLVVSERVGEDSLVDHVYDRLSYRIGKFDAEAIRESRVLTNSEWMATVVRDVYDVYPEVVYPPVDTRGFEPRPWAERERGFVSVGRLARYKNVETVIRIVDGVRAAGHDVHLHLIGPSYDDEYRRELEAMAAERDYVELDGEMSRPALVEMLCSHRYAIHGKRHEHFGMAVAEFVAAGALPFVPDDGGQREIVDDPGLRYRTPAEAVEKIDDALSAADGGASLRNDPGVVAERFGRQRFREEIREIVAAELGEEAKPLQAEPFSP